MEKGPDRVWRPLDRRSAAAESPGMSHREIVKADDVANEVIDHNLNPEEHLLAVEEAEKEQNEIEGRVEGELDFPEERWKRASEK